MPNWCSNTLHSSDERVIEVFQKLAHKQEQSGLGETFDWLKDDRYLFHIDVYDSYVQFETKWSPAIETAKNLAKVFKTEVILDYDEPGMCMYGKFIFNKEESKHYNISTQDCDSIEWDEDTGLYTYNGEEYESDSEIKEEILEKIIQQRVLND